MRVLFPAVLARLVDRLRSLPEMALGPLLLVTPICLPV
jgi:hypothetical protein